MADAATTPKRGRPQIYPWDEWTDGQVYTVEQGTDFKCPVNSFVTGLRTHGYTKDMRCRIQAEGTKVRFQFYMNTEPRPDWL